MNAKDGIIPNTKHKDALFRYIFGENKKDALSLYNAVNNSNYTNEDDLEFTTLDDVVYMKMKNDISFLFCSTLSLYEHQSTFNPNMPLRGLLYFADLYRQLIPDSAMLYGKKVFKLPTPKYVVFYNGNDNKMTQDIEKMRLSTAFEDPTVSGEFEWTATVININLGHSSQLMKSCHALSEYAIFIDKVRTYAKTMGTLEAIDTAVEECIKNNVLSDFLAKHRREVVNMTLTEFDETRFAEVCRKEGIEEGIEIGLEKGQQIGLEKGRIYALITFLQNGGTESTARTMLEATDEELAAAKGNTLHNL